MKITLENFSDMGDNGAYYLEGMSTKRYNGQSVIAPTWRTLSLISENSTNLSGLTSKFYAMDKINFNIADAGANYEYAISKQIVGITNNGKIFSFDTDGTNSHLGLIHSIPTTGSGTDKIDYSRKPDIKTTKSGNLLYSSANHLGVGFLGMNNATSTTAIVDSQGRDFTTLGVSTSAGSNKVYNLVTGEEHTITSITTTTSTNDTLNFTAGASTNTSGDMFMVFVDNRFKFNTSSSRNSQMNGQDYPYNWARQIILKGSYYWILNGNNLAYLTTDDTAWTSDVLDTSTRMLPTLTQATCISFNQNDILVGGRYRENGRLMLTDGWSDGYSSIVELKTYPDAITQYKSGWVYFSADTLNYTNGYTTRTLSELPDKYSITGTFVVPFSGMTNWEDNIIINIGSTQLYGRGYAGIWIYNIKTGWSYTPHSTNSSNGQFNYKSSAGGILVASQLEYQVAQPKIYYSCENDDTNSTNTYYVNTLDNIGNQKNNTELFYIKLPKKLSITEIELNLSSVLDGGIRSDSSGTTAKITVAVGSGRTNLLNRIQINNVGSTSSMLINKSGADIPATVGYELRALEGLNGGERRFITSIANAGTATEEITVDTAFSNAPQSSSENYELIAVKKCDTKTVTVNDLPDELKFPVNGFYSDTLVVEVHFSDNTSNTNLYTNKIIIYGS